MIADPAVVDARLRGPKDAALTSLEREALWAAAEIVRALMTPGRRFPSRRQLVRAWRLLQQLDRRALGKVRPSASAAIH